MLRACHPLAHRCRRQLARQATRGLLTCALLLTSGLGAASGAQADSSIQSWLALPTTYDLKSEGIRLQVWMDLHARRGQNSTLFIVRPALGVVLSPMAVLHAGYAWVPTAAEPVPLATVQRKDISYEQRGWQQAILSFKPGLRLGLQSRTRFEQRVPEGGGQVAFRIRQFGRLGWRVADGNPWQLVMWDEVFVGLNEVDWGPPRGYDQNRLFLGPGVDVPGLRGRVEAGYLFNHLNRSPTKLINHVLYVQFVVAAKG